MLRDGGLGQPDHRDYREGASRHRPAASSSQQSPIPGWHRRSRKNGGTWRAGTANVRVRLTPEEHAAWSAARAVTGRRELAAWVRVTVNELLSLPSGDRVGRCEPVPPVVDTDTYLTLVTVANALGELVARANAEQRFPAEQEASEVYDQVRQAVVDRAAIGAAAARARRRR